jgi:hypothetical protein
MLCLFTNGLTLSRQSATLSDGGENDEFEELYGVDVRCPVFLYYRMASRVPLVPGPISVASKNSPGAASVGITFPWLPKLVPHDQKMPRALQPWEPPFSFPPLVIPPPARKKPGTARIYISIQLTPFIKKKKYIEKAQKKLKN